MGAHRTRGVAHSTQAHGFLRAHVRRRLTHPTSTPTDLVSGVDARGQALRRPRHTHTYTYTKTRTHTPASCSVDEGQEGGMLSLGPCANLLLFAWRGVAVEVRVWSAGDHAVRPTSAGLQRACAHTHCTSQLAVWAPSHLAVWAAHILNCMPAAGACSCKQVRAQAHARC